MFLKCIFNIYKEIIGLCINYSIVNFLQMSRTEGLLQKMAVICTVNIKDVPEYKDYFDITIIPATVFFFNSEHIKVDSG